MDLRAHIIPGEGCRDPRLFGGWVSPFGNLRIKACLAAPRSVSHAYYVLHRSSVPRHPPYALMKNLLSAPVLVIRMLHSDYLPANAKGMAGGFIRVPLRITVRGKVEQLPRH